jgi:hypothetical protein
VCPSPLSTFEPSDRFYEIQNGVHDIEDDLNAKIVNPVTLTIPKWRTFKLLTWMQNVHQPTWDHEFLYAEGCAEDGELLKRPLLREIKNTNMVGG